MTSGELFMKIRIENFRSIATLELDLTPGTVGIFAPNGTGKTNVGLAMMQLHLGFCSKGDKNFPVESLVRRGSTGYRIEIETPLYAISEVRKGRTLEVEASWQGEPLKGSRAEIREQLLEKFGLSGLSQTGLRDEWMRTVFVRPASISILDLEFSKPTEFAAYLASLLGLGEIDRAREIIQTELREQEAQLKVDAPLEKVDPITVDHLIKRRGKLENELRGQTRYAGEDELNDEYAKRMTWLETSLGPLRQDRLRLSLEVENGGRLPVDDAEKLRGRLKMLPRAENIPQFEVDIEHLKSRQTESWAKYSASVEKLEQQQQHLEEYAGTDAARLEQQAELYPHYRLKDSAEEKLASIRDQIAKIITKYREESAGIEEELGEIEPQLDGVELQEETAIREEEGATRAELRNTKEQKIAAESNLQQAKTCPVCHSPLLVVADEFVKFDTELARQQVSEFERKISELDARLAQLGEQKKLARLAERVANLRARIHRIKELETSQLTQLRLSETEALTFVDQISKGKEWWLKWEAYQKAREICANLETQRLAHERLDAELKLQVANYEKMISQAREAIPEWQKLNAHDACVTAERELAQVQKRMSEIEQRMAEEEESHTQKLALCRKLEPLFCEYDLLKEKIASAQNQNERAKLYAEWESRMLRIQGFVEVRKQLLPKLREWVSGKLSERILIFEDVVNQVAAELGAPQIRIKQDDDNGKTGCSIVTLQEETSPRWEYSDGQAAVLKTAFALAHRMAFPVKVQHIPFVFFDDPGPAVHRDMQEELYRGLSRALSMPGLKAEHLFVASAYENAEVLFRPAHVVNL